MRLLVCGGRSYSDRQKLFAALDAIHAATPVTVLIHGGASGADTLAGEWAALRGILVQVFEADWGSHGRAAGPIRNGAMLKEGRPDLVAGFPGGPGTKNMTSQARTAGVRVVEIA